MSRTVMVKEFTCSIMEAQYRINNVLMAKGYKPYTMPSGEAVWKMGTGMLTAMHYIKVEFAANAFSLAGWVQIGVGSVAGKERDLEGFVGCIPKQSVKNTMLEIMRMFQ